MYLVLQITLEEEHVRTGQCFERVTGALRDSKKSLYTFLKESGSSRVLEWRAANFEGGLVKIFKNI